MKISVASLNEVRLRTLPPLALYIHIPWCVRKCPYCDFNSHEARGTLPEAEYAAALIADLELSLPRIWGRPIYTVFLGGGTPSIFSPETIDSVLGAVRARVPLSHEVEITLEANPGTMEVGKFAGFRSAGVNRLSIGVQSFNPCHLVALGRIHDADDARRALEHASRYFDNFNVDLMYALPQQTIDEARADIAAALEFQPPHLSAYHLTIEPNTYFHRYPPALPDEDAGADMQEAIEAELGAKGYEHYETSAFAKPGHRCRHNVNYWLFGDYLGIGAGAHSKLSFPDRIVREMRYRQPRDYMRQASEGTPVQESHEVAACDVPFEFMMNALRLNDGFPLYLFEERTGLPLTSVTKALDFAEARGLVTRSHERVQPTALGRRFLNDLLQIFMA
jgi:putative oxygen-independent coproporphyrinogen III oxidase